MSDDGTTAGLDRQLTQAKHRMPKPVRHRSASVLVPLLVAIALGLLLAVVFMPRPDSDLTVRRGEIVRYPVRAVLPGSLARPADLEPKLRGCPVDVNKIQPAAALGVRSELVAKFEFDLVVRSEAQLGRTICTIDWGEFNQEFVINIEEA